MNKLRDSLGVKIDFSDEAEEKEKEKEKDGKKKKATSAKSKVKVRRCNSTSEVAEISLKT